MQKLLMTGFLCLSLGAKAQEVSFSEADSLAMSVESAAFVPPFDFPLYLSGNFGELRPNHFHGGLDFKTQGVIGKPVRVVADGYVSRITVSPTGYGNALYVTHPNGYTSVYGHLDHFIPSIARYVEDCQYERESFAVDLRPDSTLFGFTQGEVIAYSGNTGSSGGPHLHLEVRATATDEMLDPMPFFRDHLRDTRAPRSQAVIFYPQPGAGVVNGGADTQSFAWTNNGKGLNTPVTAWGTIGVGIRANDYMDGTSNIYGVRSIVLTVDGREVFGSQIDRVAHDENRTINSWADYEAYRRRRVWYVKSFVEPGNRLRLLRTDVSRGWITIDEERDYRLCYRLEDAFGNVSVYECTVRGCRQPIPSVNREGRQLLHWDKAHVIQRPGLQLTVPRGMLYDDVWADVRVESDTIAPSWVYQLHDRPIPLHSYCPLRIRLRQPLTVDSTKYYIAQRSAGRLMYVGGTYDAGWLKASIRELGTYVATVDTIAPEVTPVGKGAWTRTGRVIYRVKDAQTGIATYRGMLDGHFVLFEYSARDRQLVCHLSRARIGRGKMHTLTLTVTDGCGNTRVVKEQIKW